MTSLLHDPFGNALMTNRLSSPLLDAMERAKQAEKEWVGRNYLGIQSPAWMPPMSRFEKLVETENKLTRPFPVPTNKLTAATTMDGFPF